MLVLDDAGPLRRAYAAYFRDANLHAGQPLQPNESMSGLRQDGEGRRYVVLQNVDRVLAVYRVRTSGVLKRLRLWPPELGQA